MEATVRECDGIDEALTQGSGRSTIFARSTGALPSAIAIVRISGPNAAATARTLTRKPLPRPRMATLRRLYGPGEALPLDEALVLWLPGPATVTGEDLLELHLHGGRAVVAAVEEALSNLPGLCPAEPGAFTRRAFENGRLDLTQVEGLADLLAAETERQRSAAMAAFEGGLRREIAGWQHRVVLLSARAEAAIDFSDEDDVVPDDDSFRQDLRDLERELSDAIARPPMERLRDGVRVGIGGSPNAGKSSLINAIVGRDVAISSPVPGTTRDLIEVPVAIDGLPLLIIDMAGLRESDDLVEAIGVGRAFALIERLDILVWLDTGPVPPTSAKVLRVATKSDLGSSNVHADHQVSATTGEGLAGLRAEIAQMANELLPVAGAGVALNMHQRAGLSAARFAIETAALNDDPVLCAEDLRQAMRAFDRITGTSDTEAMLDALFGKFCIGK